MVQSNAGREDAALKQSGNRGREALVEMREVSEGDVLILPDSGKALGLTKVITEAPGPG